MKTIPQSGIGGIMKYVFEFDFTDLNDTAGLTKTLQVLPEVSGQVLPTGFTHWRCVLDVTTAFAGCTTLVVRFGDIASTNRFLTDTTLKTAAVTAPAAVAKAEPANEAFKIVVTATVDNLTSLSAGAARILFEAEDITKYRTTYAV